MKFIVFEVQTAYDGTVGTLTYSYDKKPEASFQYHTVAAAASVSQTLVHGVYMLTNEGNTVPGYPPVFYRHPAPQPEPEPEIEEPSEPSEEPTE